MIRISGIRYQRELESLPYFNKKTAEFLIGKKGKNLEKKINQLKKKDYLLNLKKGLYVTTAFVERKDRAHYIEYIANILRYPSYLSLEYVLANEGVIPEGVAVVTSVTLKSSRVFTNFLGTFVYRNLKPLLFYGFKEKSFDDKKILVASRAKALFDFLYLKKMDNLKQEIVRDLRLNWEVFNPSDRQDFKKFVSTSSSFKMKKIYQILKKEVLFRASEKQTCL